MIHVKTDDGIIELKTLNEVQENGVLVATIDPDSLACFLSNGIGFILAKYVANNQEKPSMATIAKKQQAKIQVPPSTPPEPTVPTAPPASPPASPPAPPEPPAAETQENAPKSFSEDQINRMKAIKQTLDIKNNNQLNPLIYESSIGRLSKWQDLTPTNINEFIVYMEKSLKNQ